jgi:NADH-quinone oxidoreductase subunit M
MPMSSVQFHAPLLSLLILFPLASGAASFALRESIPLRTLALGAALVELLFSLLVAARFEPAAGMQYVEHHAWIPSLHMDYLLGIDGFSVVFLPLTALLTVASILASWNRPESADGAYLGLLLMLEGITMGLYCSLDLGLFFLFWELSLVPLFFLIGLWGEGPHRRHAAFQYTLTMLASGLLILAGFILVALNHAQDSGNGAWSFAYLNLLDTPASIRTQTVVFFLLLLGFAVKAPLFPFHFWLPTVAMQGPAAVTALLVGLKLGLFGIIRFAIPLAPQAANLHSDIMAWMGITGALYGALVALRQTNLRRLLAYSSVSHVGMVLIGVAALNIQGIQGAAFQLFNFGIVSGGLFFLAGFIQHRLGSTELTALGGIARSMPRLTTLFFVLGLAALGIPGTSGFPAEHLIIIGALKSRTGMGLAALLGVILGAGYFLGYFRMAFLGPVKHRSVATADDLLPREMLVAATMAAIVLILGLLPEPFMNFSRNPLQDWIARTEAGPGNNTLANQAPQPQDSSDIRLVDAARTH